MRTRLSKLFNKMNAKALSAQASGSPTARFLPLPHSDKRACLWQSAVLRLKKVLQYKIRSNSKLSPVDRHLVESFPKLQRNLFAPSYLEVLKSISLAFIKPSLSAMGLLVLYLTVQTGIYQLSPEKLAEAEIDQIDFVDLALSLAEEKEKSALAAASTHSWLPKFNSTPTAKNLNTARVSTKKPLDNSLRTQRSLVKFISGIIAAFKPDIRNSSNISKLIVEISATENVDPIYVAAVIAIESRFISTAKSGAGALGLMQLMPATAKEVANSANHRSSHLSDPRTNIRLGISYLKQLDERFKGNQYLVLAAYNWGPNNIAKVNQRKKRIPGSVQKYARTVINRAAAWRQHFETAIQAAENLQTVAKDSKGYRG